MRLLCLVLFAFAFIGIDYSHAAPPQLYNKTVSFGWSVQSTVRDPDGKERGNTSNISYVVYVSTAGRLFERASRSDAKHAQMGDNAPGTTQTGAGEARGLHFEGNSLVANRGYSGAGGSGAMCAVVSFTSTSCSVR